MTPTSVRPAQVSETPVGKLPGEEEEREHDRAEDEQHEQKGQPGRPLRRLWAPEGRPTPLHLIRSAVGRTRSGAAPAPAPNRGAAVTTRRTAVRLPPPLP